MAYIFNKSDVGRDSVNDLLGFLNKEINKREPPSLGFRGLGRPKGLHSPRRSLRPRSFGATAGSAEPLLRKDKKEEEKEIQPQSAEEEYAWAVPAAEGLFESKGLEEEPDMFLGAFPVLPQKEQLEDIIEKKLHMVFERGVTKPFFEIRPNRSKHPVYPNENLEYDLLILSDRQVRLNKEVLKIFLEKEGYHKGKIQFHFNDIIQGKLHSITTGNIETGDIILELADFLSKYDENFVIPLHLPFFEQWKDDGELQKWGGLSKDSKKNAIANADKVLKYICSKWKYGGMIALETGQGLYKPDGKVLYGLLGDDPAHFTDLVKDKEDKVAIVLDVGHMNLVEDFNYKDHLIRLIREIHFHGNDGKKDLHLLPSPQNLKDYQEISSFLKYFTGQICFETKRRQDMSILDYLKTMRDLIQNLFTEPTMLDTLSLDGIKIYLGSKNEEIYSGNIKQELPPAQRRSKL